jgi:REP element-mobilizing transposase RayT
MNRGVGQRSIFETGEDVRHFCSRMALAVRRRDIEVHAWCAMTTHFHLLVRSPCGRLHAAMQRIQRDYSAWFNRRRGRDGPLYRSRYTSRTVDTLGYRRTVVRYIDANAANAKLTPCPLRYPHGSAVAHSTGARQPWLDRGWIRQETLRATGAASFAPELYATAFPPLLSAEAREWIEARLQSPAEARDELDDLLTAAPQGFLEWLWRRTECADGTRPGLPMASTAGVLAEFANLRAGRTGLEIVAPDDWRMLEIGLLRDLAAASYAEIGARFGISAQGASAARARHVSAVRNRGDYARTAAESAQRILTALHGAR